MREKYSIAVSSSSPSSEGATNITFTIPIIFFLTAILHLQVKESIIHSYKQKDQTI